MASDCPHDGLRDIRSAYNARRGVLVYFWTCASCGAQLHEARREKYRPRFDARGNDPFLARAS